MDVSVCSTWALLLVVIVIVVAVVVVVVVVLAIARVVGNVLPRRRKEVTKL